MDEAEDLWILVLPDKFYSHEVLPRKDKHAVFLQRFPER